MLKECYFFCVFFSLYKVSSLLLIIFSLFFSPSFYVLFSYWLIADEDYLYASKLGQSANSLARSGFGFFSLFFFFFFFSACTQLYNVLFHFLLFLTCWSLSLTVSFSSQWIHILISLFVSCYMWLYTLLRATWQLQNEWHLFKVS